ncbi:flagellar assembly protein FliH [Paenibacillus phyllosphaerae]|uniref:Flagellar assembly protein FliH n=1 Tax=Paenibacillus phyllosphaerae TaxID=274593 RepID=A0A7W5FLM6_9BACL|nr:FliH/SctL family protein [Paenibacillus phyllosphaerae]MBB3109390.1 flagellar assembly protein FliH [Paenibacillus phyllosphaerae]
MSSLFKSTHVVSLEDLKRLEVFRNYYSNNQSGEDLNTPAGPDEETVSLRDQIINDAESFAKQRMEEAAQEIQGMYEAANAEIEQWWQERRELDLQHFEQMRSDGYQQGYNEGRTEAEEEIRQQWETSLSEAKTILEGAYRMKEEIIQEAEPFVVDLSIAIAEKIIGRQLSLSPELMIEFVRRALQRRREQGVITLCVAPTELAFIQAAQEELKLSIDSQAELQIVPDVTVKEGGCVIRSAFGSIDARIDTQLGEIKRQLMELALQADDHHGGADHHA